mmetsp:Transcript_53629/g.160557  ORF Transcript_53629/g.160557 Transcript_53629/m.160557 type:complete len:86 (+) Transcript_53629:1638-1895(+)
MRRRDARSIGGRSNGASAGKGGGTRPNGQSRERVRRRGRRTQPAGTSMGVEGTRRREGGDAWRISGRASPSGGVEGEQVIGPWQK